LVSQLEALFSGALADILMEDLFSSGVGDAIVSGGTTPVACSGGGSQSQECTDLETGAVLAYAFDQCVTVMDGVEMRIDGDLSISTKGTCEAPFPLDETAASSFVGTIDKTIVDTAATFSVGENVMMTFRLESDGTTRFTVNGSLDASCVAGVATVQTLQPVVTAGGEDCPTEGLFLIVLNGELHEIAYTPTGGVEFDVGGDNFVDAVYASCDDPLIEQCFQ
jgi:hypothetical protein